MHVVGLVRYFRGKENRRTQATCGTDSYPYEVPDGMYTWHIDQDGTIFHVRESHTWNVGCCVNRDTWVPGHLLSYLVRDTHVCTSSVALIAETAVAARSTPTAIEQRPLYIAVERRSALIIDLHRAGSACFPAVQSCPPVWVLRRALHRWSGPPRFRVWASTKLLVETLNNVADHYVGVPNSEGFDSLWGVSHCSNVLHKEGCFYAHICARGPPRPTCLCCRPQQHRWRRR